MYIMNSTDRTATNTDPCVTLKLLFLYLNMCFMNLSTVADLIDRTGQTVQHMMCNWLKYVFYMTVQYEV